MYDPSLIEKILQGTKQVSHVNLHSKKQILQLHTPIPPFASLFFHDQCSLALKTKMPLQHTATS